MFKDSELYSHCPHVISHALATNVEINKLNKITSCAYCDYSGPNLWICMQRNCLRVGCSEKANDHSTEHFRLNNKHCLHMNLTSQRAWCYLCEREISVEERSSQSITEQLNKVMRPVDDNESIEATGLVGLQNIANTCYMNSALQALSNVQPLTHYFLSSSELDEVSTEQETNRNKVGLAKSYQHLIKDIWGKKDHYECIAPRDILRGIRNVQPMFHGFQQHDTQEFLRCFMNQLHEELKGQSPNLQRFCFNEDNIDREHLNHSDNENDCLSSSSSSSHSHSTSDTDYETCDSTVSDQNVYPEIRRCKSGVKSRMSYKKTKSSLNCKDDQKEPSTHRSIITDVFDGKLLSSVQCLTCDRISTREETFQDLSLPIPNRDYINMLHQTHTISGQSINSLDTPSSGITNGWFVWIWNLLHSWLWGPSVSLHDCMASFFSADELKGDNMYSCAKCNKLRTGVKYSQIIELPEVLCIHLKRFRHDLLYSSKISSQVHFPLEGFDMRPYLHKDCSSQVAIYNLASVICHHGTVGSGHYTCFARNALTNRWYEYDDQNVVEVTPNYIQNCQAYVLFYHKYNPQLELVRKKAIELSASSQDYLVDIRFYIAREWLIRFQTFAEPGPINNWSMLCIHGGLLQTKSTLLSQIAVPISQPLWDYLYGIFGGGPAINMLFECQVCKRASEALEHRQNYELSIFTKYNEIDVESNAIYAISMPWLRKWQQYSRGLTHKEPGPIMNSNIVPTLDTLPSLSPIKNVRPGSDYAQISGSLWRFFLKIYGGGPEVILRGSPTDEIEISECDDYNTNSKRNITDFTDTENNTGNCIKRQTFEMQDDKEAANIIKKNSVKSTTPNKVKVSHYQSSNIPMTNKNDVNINKMNRSPRSNFRNSKRHHNMRNSEMFGAKGSYTSHDDSVKVENVFENGEESSLHMEQPILTDPKTKFSSHREIYYSDSDNSYIHNRTPKSRDKVTLQRFAPLRDHISSIGTDA